MNKSLALGAASAALLLALTACGDSGTEESAATTNSAATTSVSAENGAAEHNDADIAFAQGMVPHHSQAIEMSDVLLAKQGIDPRVVDLAQQIKAAQGPEIEQLNAWLTAWGQGAAATTTTGMNMTESMPMGTGMQMPEAPVVIPPAGTSEMDMPGMEGGEDMEGMMSAEDMAALRDAQGVDAAKLFLTQMIEHHKGAITLAQTEVEDGQNAQAKAMAQNIITTQQQEITTMEQILSTL
ncbi:DUF305 domain-containing protein [Rhodococcus oxybenzonivorans]|uniref:DUF305 domain-containing protein n=1 Tax=Rhodococcus oxybenzonivorans TaxID=1990687 RepID=A0A2S2C0F1_9NOCA|nr:DUF305 domain-containing protein [Rhodococcus oxybenzonivorans]AWK74218.1 DUF305 domain-containing protein [Rhodococcus oxybenzonivorans]